VKVSVSNVENGAQSSAVGLLMPNNNVTFVKLRV